MLPFPAQKALLSTRLRMKWILAPWSAGPPTPWGRVLRPVSSTCSPSGLQSRPWPAPPPMWPTPLSRYRAVVWSLGRKVVGSRRFFWTNSEAWFMLRTGCGPGPLSQSEQWPMKQNLLSRGNHSALKKVITKSLISKSKTISWFLEV